MTLVPLRQSRTATPATIIAPHSTAKFHTLSNTGLVAAATAAWLILSSLATAHEGMAQDATQDAMPDAEPATLSSGTYTLDPTHTLIIFRVMHMGFSPFAGAFDATEGTLDFNADDPAASALSITVKADSVDTNSDHLDDGLKDAKMFDVGTYPDVTFTATEIEVTGDDTGTITGDLTIKDVTKPVTLNARLTGYGVHPMKNAKTLGFYADTKITRSEFGLNEWLGLVGDAVTLSISAEFNETAPETVPETEPGDAAAE